MTQSIHAAGCRRALNLAPAPAHLVGAFAAPAADVPEAGWKGFDLWPKEVAIKDQSTYSACDGHAAALGDELARYVAGMPHVALSAWYPYAILCNGVDRGASIAEALTLIQSRGVAPESDVPYGTIDPRRLTAAAHADAARFRAEAGAALTTQAQIMSAVQRLEPINLSIGVGSDFNNLDPEGVPPLLAGTDNHAVTVFGGAKLSRRHGWLVKMANSWGTTWGINGGFCWLPLNRLASSPYFQAYRVDSMMDDPDGKRPFRVTQ